MGHFIFNIKLKNTVVTLVHKSMCNFLLDFSIHMIYTILHFNNLFIDLFLSITYNRNRFDIN